MFWVQTIQLESSTCCRFPRRSCEVLKKTPLVWMRSCADCRSKPTTLGIAKFTAADVGAGGGVVAAGGWTAADGCAVVDWTVVGADAAAVSLESLQPARVPPPRARASAAPQTQGFFPPDFLWTGCCRG